MLALSFAELKWFVSSVHLGNCGSDSTEKSMIVECILAKSNSYDLILVKCYLVYNFPVICILQ